MTTELTTEEIERTLKAIAKEFIDQGPGFAQETVVIREATQRLGIGKDLKLQQRLLTVWHDLFRNGKLAWGYNVDNPSAPFFHFAER